MLDEYWFGDTARISPEAPVPVVRARSAEQRPGGAANVALNVAALGARSTLAAVVGQDERAASLTRALEQRGVRCELFRSPTLPTIHKLRVLARSQQLLRIDAEQSLQGCADEFGALYERLVPQADVVILSDYGKGTLSRVEELVSAARTAKIPVLIDPKGTDFKRYRGAYALTPNRSEFEAVVGRCRDEAELLRRGEELRKDLDLDLLLVTRGEQGMTLFEQDAEPLTLPTQAREVFDVTGAGDTVAAVMGLASAAGMPWVDAARLANAAAGIVVGTVGTAVAESETLARVVAGEASQARSKVLSRAALTARVADARANGVRIVLTNGCFDLLHVGHLHLLQRARALGDILVVAINDDASVKRLKGQNRPLIPEVQRAEMLAALRFVDYVTLFSELTPLRLIQTVRPDVLVKGGDYTLDQVVGRDVVERYGGRIEIVPLLPGLSTSGLVDAINRRKTS